MKPIQILVQPWRKSAGARVDVRVGDSPSAEGYGAGGFEWEPAITSRPTLSLELMPLELDGKTQVGKAHFVLQLGSIQNVADAKTLDYQGAPLTIWSTDDLGWDRRVVEFAGNVMTARYDTENGTLTVDAEASTILIERPLLTLSFSGAGGLNGETNKRGILRPAGFGTVFYVEPVWFDETYNIGQLDGYGNLLSIQKAMEGADDRTAGFVNDYANYAALKAAIIAKTIPPGRWGSSIADGIVGLGAPPLQGVPWGFNCTFGYGKPGSLMQRIIQFHAGVPIGQIDTVSFAAITAQVEAVLGTTADIGYWSKDQRQVIDLLQAVAGSVNAAPLVTLQGTFTVSRGVTSAPVQTLDRSGSVDPRVINWKSADSRSPYYQLKARTARPARVLARDEVLYTDTLVDMNVWSAGTGYRIGNTVYGSDGAQFLYTNGTPTVGPALPTSTYPPAAMATNAYWQQITRPPPTSGSMIGVADGATADLVLTSIGTQTVTIAGNKVTRDAGASDYAAAVRGGAIQGPQFAEMDILAGNWSIICLDDDAPSTATTALLYQVQFNQSTGAWGIYINNVAQFTGSLGAGITGKLRISYDGIRYRAYVNATQLGSDIAASASNLILWPKWIIFNSPAHTGLRAGPYTANIWADIAGPGTPANNATAPFILIPLDANVAVTGNELRAVTSTSSSAYISYPATGSAEFSWKADVSSNHNFICGFVLAANVASTTGSSLAYGLEASGGNLYVWAGGTQTLLGISTAGDRYKITYDGVNFRAYKNGVEITAALKPATAAATYFGRLGLNGTVGVKLTEVASASFSQNNFSDIGGQTRPADNAGTNINLTKFASTNLLIQGNSVTQQVASNWNVFFSQQVLPNAAVASWRLAASSTYAAGGLKAGAQPASDASPNGIGFSILTTGTQIFYYDGAGGSTAAAGTPAAGDVYTVSIDNVAAYYWRTTAAGTTTLLGSVPVTAGQSYRFVGQVFIGTITDIMLSAGTDNQWSSNSGPGLPANNATADLTLTSFGSQAVSIIGNTFQRTAAAGDFNAVVRSPLMNGAIIAEMDILAGSAWTIMSLDSGAASGVGSSNVLYCQYNQSSGSITIYASGVTVLGTTIATGLTGKLQLLYDRVRLRVMVAGTQYGADIAASSPNLQLYARWTDYSGTPRVTGCQARALSSSNLWGDVGGANVPAPNATADLTLATGSYSTAAHTIVGNTVTKATGANWDAFVGSKEAQKGTASVTFVLPQIGVVGLTSTPQGYASGATAQYSALNYGVNNNSGVNWNIYEGGTLVAALGTALNGVTFSANTVWRIDYDGVNARYYADGVLMRTSTAAAGQTLYVGVALNTVGGTCSRIAFGAFTDNNWTSIPNGPANVFALGGTEDIKNTLMTATVDTAGTGGRARVGLLTNGISTGGLALLPTNVQNLDQEWTDVQNTAGKRPSDNAGTTVTISPVTPADMQVIGNSVYRKAGASAWNRGFNVLEAQTNGIAVKWTHISGAADYMVGLMTAAITDAANNYTQPIIAVRPIGVSIFVYMLGNPQNGGSSVGTAAVGDVYTITYDNLFYRLYKTTSAGATTLLFSIAATAGLTLHPVGTIADTTGGVVISNLQSAPYTNQNWGDVGGANRPADNATADIALATGSYSSAAHSFVGNNITKTTGGGWDAFVGSKQGFAGNASVTFVLPNSPAMAGLTATPQGYPSGATSQYIALSFGIYSATNPTWQVYESGVMVEDLGTSKNGVTFSANTVWRIDYDGVNARYYADGVLMRTSTATASLLLYFGAAIYSVNGQTNRVSLSSFTDRNFGNIGGATRPEDNADVTANNLVSLSCAPTQGVAYDYTITAKTGELTRDLTNFLKKGGADISSSATWSFTPSGCTITAGSNGVVTLNTVSATDAAIAVSAVYGGKTYTGRISITKRVDLPPAGGTAATAFSGSAAGTVNETAYTTPIVLGTGTMRTNGSGQARLNCTINYSAPLHKALSVNVKWQKSLMGANTWSDTTLSGTGTTATGSSGSPDDYGVEGSAVTNTFATGLTASTDYDFRLVALLVPGTGAPTTVAVEGSISGSQT